MELSTKDLFIWFLLDIRENITFLKAFFINDNMIFIEKGLPLRNIFCRITRCNNQDKNKKKVTAILTKMTFMYYGFSQNLVAKVTFKYINNNITGKLKMSLPDYPSLRACSAEHRAQIVKRRENQKFFESFTVKFL